MTDSVRSLTPFLSNGRKMIDPRFWSGCYVDKMAIEVEPVIKFCFTFCNKKEE